MSEEKERIQIKKYITLLIAIVSILFIISFPNATITEISVFGGVEPAGEIWITQIKLDGQKDTLSDYPLSGNWRHIDENIVYVPGESQSGIQELKLQFKNAKSVQLRFAKHNWSGGVGISDGDEYTEINLYDEAGEQLYDVKNIKPVSLNPLPVIIGALSLGILLGFMRYMEKHESQKTMWHRWELVAVNALIVCRITDTFGKIEYILPVVLVMYCLFVKSKKQNCKAYGMTLLFGFSYSLYQFENSYLPEPQVVLGVLLFLVLFYSFELGKGKKWGFYAVVLITPILCFFMIELISNVKIVQLKPSMVCMGVLLISGFLFVIVQLFFMRNLGWYLGFIAMFALSVGNYYVIQFKKYALTFGDLLQLQTGVAVMGDYQYVLSDGIVYGFLLLVTLISLVYVYIPEKTYSKEIAANHILTGVLAASLQAGVLYSVDFEKAFHIVWDNWDTTQTYSQYGFPVSFIVSAQRMKLDKPTGYSKEKAELLLDTYSFPETTEGGEKPVIIAIMNESFADLGADLGSLGETEDVMWYINSMEDYLEKGKTLVSVRGGGTCNSEFEFLTGNSMEFFGDLYPYTQYNFTEIPSLTQILKKQGYRTVAMHPEDATNYRRQGVYEEMGFDEFYSFDSYDKYEKIFSNRTSDRDVYREILRKIENSERDEPLFIFNVTIQNHGDFDMKQFHPDYERIRIDPELAQYESVWMYLSLIKESNNALDFLVRELKKIERPVLLCVFGDHQPGCLSKEFENGIFQYDETKSDLENQQRYNLTPYFIWANYKTGTADTNKEEQLTSLNYLTSKILRYAGLESSGWFRFLDIMQEEIPAMNRFSYVGNDGIWYHWDDTNRYEKWIQDYRILQYYQVLEKR